MSKYQTITGISGYDYGIYSNGEAVLQTNGRRFRARVDCVRWHGNTGGAHESVRYMDRTEGRKVLRQLRQAKVAELKGGWCGRTIPEILLGY